MNSYEVILNELIRSIKERDGEKFNEELGVEHRSLTLEGMVREGICQILANENFWFRWNTLIHHPKLIVPYLFRIKPKKESK